MKDFNLTAWMQSPAYRYAKEQNQNQINKQVREHQTKFDFSIPKEDRLKLETAKMLNRRELQQYYGKKRCGHINIPEKEMATIYLRS